MTHRRVFILIGILLPWPAMRAVAFDWEAWTPLLGEWTAQGEGSSGNGAGRFAYHFDLDGHILVRTNHVSYRAADDRPALVQDDLMIIHPDAGGHDLEALDLDNEGHVIDYEATVDQRPGRWTFVSIPRADSPRFRLVTTWKDRRRLDLSFAMAEPGQLADYKPYLLGTAQRSTGTREEAGVPMAAGVASAPMSRLATMAGRWIGTTTIFPASWNPVTSTVRCERVFTRALGGHALVGRYRENWPDGHEFSGLDIIAWDEDARGYRSLWCDSDGSVDNARGALTGADTLVLTYHAPASGDTEEHDGRLTYRFPSPDRLVVTLEARRARGDWKPVLESRLERPAGGVPRQQGQWR